MARIVATLTSKGQLTVPKEVRDAWGLKAGDQLGFEVLGPREGKVEPIRRRSIFEGLDELAIRLDAPLTQHDIDGALDEAVDEKLRRSGWTDRP